MTETEFKCEACGKITVHDFATREPFPLGWFNHQINEQGNLNIGDTKPYLLCESCGNEGHFIGGMSPSLKSLFRRKGIHF